MGIELKLNDDGFAEVKDGKPVYVDDQGKEHTYDAPAMRNSLDKLNNDLNETRRSKEQSDEALKQFGEIKPEDARKAIETVQNLEDQKLVDAGEVQKVKDETARAYQERIDEANKELENVRSSFASEKLGNAFSGSKFANESLAIPPDMAQSYFGKHFEYENGRITPKDSNGNPIYSDSNPGDVASFDEALEKLVNQYPYRDRILRGSGQNGSGSGPVDEGGKRKISREQFGNMSPDQQQQMAAAAQKGEVQITD